MIARASEVGIRKRNPPVRLPAQNIPRRRLAVGAEEKTRLRIHVRVSPTIENDSGNVPAWIETSRCEHVAHLLAERALVLREGSAEQLRTPLRALFGDRESGLGEQYLYSEHRR